MNEQTTTERSRVMRLEDYRGDSQKLDVEVFSKRHGDAFFLHHGPIGKLREPAHLGQSTIESEGVPTALDKPFSPQANFLVFPVCRSDTQSLEEELIWVGRSPDNHVCIRDATISEVHAFLSTDEKGRFFLRDIGSKNGTFVNDKRVPAQGMGQAMQLESGSRVRFGEVGMTFLRVAEFHTLIRRILG